MAATKDNPIIFYDLVNASGTSWSTNLYKTRISLNYKGLPYRVEGILFPDIESRMKELGVPPVSETFPYYTLPVIADPSSDPNGKPTYVADSFKIALYLDDKYPSPQYPAIFAPGTRGIQHLIMTQYFPVIGASVGPVIFPGVLRLLDSRSAEYVRRTRGDRVNPLPDEVAARKWQETREKFATFSKSISLNDGSGGGGPFIMGKQVSFLDFTIGGTFHWIKNVEGSDSPRFKEMLEWQDGRWGTLWEHIQEIENNSSQVV